MKLGMNMIREYADIPVSPKDYESKMIMSGTAVEGVEDVADGMDKVVVGRVLTCEDVEGTHLHQCTVDVGGEEPLHIVCGAPNVKVGVLVPVALDGSHLPGGVKIKKGKLRGMVSEGMLCSATELKVPQELYPSVGDAGLLIFNEEYAVGSDVRPILGIDDYAVDFEILANRPDCLCAVGIARETAAALDTTFKAPKTDVTEAGGDIHDEVKVRVEAPDLCPRYAARVIRNVRVAPSPLWLRKYLHAAGLRSINNIVDITNFVMIEYGHPMHAFDLSKVAGREIIVRRAREGEVLTTLDGVERKLRTDDLCICDANNATGLAGIMGGEESEIIEGTTDVMFECAAFDRTAIRLTSRALGMRTEASGRFERGVCAATVMDALDRACHLVNVLNAGDVVSGVIDLYPEPKPQQVITASVKLPGGSGRRGGRLRGMPADVRLRPHRRYAPQGQHHAGRRQPHEASEKQAGPSPSGHGLSGDHELFLHRPEGDRQAGSAGKRPAHAAHGHPQSAGRGHRRHAAHAGLRHAQDPVLQHEPRHRERFSV